MKKFFQKLLKKLPLMIVVLILLATTVTTAFADVQYGPWSLSWTCDAESVKVAFDSHNWPVHMGHVVYADGSADLNVYQWNGQHTGPYTYGGTGVPIVVLALDGHKDTAGPDHPGRNTHRALFFPVECKAKVFKVHMWLYDPGTVLDGFACLIVNDVPSVPSPERVTTLCGEWFADNGYEGEYVASAPVCYAPVTANNGWACDELGYSRYPWKKLLQQANKHPD